VPFQLASAVVTTKDEAASNATGLTCFLTGLAAGEDIVTTDPTRANKLARSAFSALSSSTYQAAYAASAPAYASTPVIPENVVANTINFFNTYGNAGFKFAPSSVFTNTLSDRAMQILASNKSELVGSG
jgi:hypothetical protein